MAASFSLPTVRRDMALLLDDVHCCDALLRLLRRGGGAPPTVRQSLPSQERIETQREATADLGMIGLGRLGTGLSRRLLRGGHRVVPYDRVPEAVKGVADATTAASLEALVD